MPKEKLTGPGIRKHCVSRVHAGNAMTLDNQPLAEVEIIRMTAD
jgi:hypothetical protein